jgi:hypothetical protein
MKEQPKGHRAALLRQRKFQLLDRFAIPPDLLPGSLTRSFTRCGNANCHCVNDQGHESWTLTFMARGQRRVERIPRQWVQEVEQRVAAGREFQDAVREVLAANAELLVLARRQRKKKREHH